MLRSFGVAADGRQRYSWTGHCVTCLIGGETVLRRERLLKDSLTASSPFMLDTVCRASNAVTGKILRASIEQSLEVQSRLVEACLPALTAAADGLISAYRAGGKAFFFGNGGSAADAQHLAAEFVGRFLIERDPLPAIALNANSSALTAIANDYGYKMVFARQLQALAAPGDVAVAISTSGNSQNVIEAVLLARRIGLLTVGLTGASGG